MMASNPVSDERLPAAGQDEAIPNLVLSSDIDRHCAACHTLVPLKAVKICGKCCRRAYCSPECQAIDWKIEKKDATRSQGHSKWCGLSYGEEDLDWVLREKFDPSSGVSLGLGVFAKRFIPSTSRIMVDYFQGHGLVVSADIIRDRCTIMKAVGRSKHLGHNCNGNANTQILLDLRVRIVYSKRGINPDEEITINILGYNDSLGSIIDPDTMYGNRRLGTFKTFSDCRRVLESKFNIICPSDCFCRDDDMDNLIISLRKAIEALYRKEDCLGFYPMPTYLVVPTVTMVKELERLLADLDKTGVCGLSRATYLRLAWRLASHRKKTLPLAHKFIKEAYDIYCNIFHPQSTYAMAVEMFVREPDQYEKYICIDY